MKKPAFINKVQKVKAGVVRVRAVTADVSKAVDGAYPVDAFPPGLAEMAEDDWRQFELTPENAIAMVKDANEQIAAGKKLRYNYAHDSNGAIAGRIVRAELTQEGGVRAWVQWTDPAQTSIRAGEWEGTSPEFFANVVQDDKGSPVEQNGRVLMRPFALVGGALDNDPAMPDLAIAANTESQQPEGGKEEPIMETKKLAALLGLPETASVEDVEKKLTAALKKAVTAACPTCGKACVTKASCPQHGAFNVHPDDLPDETESDEPAEPTKTSATVAAVAKAVLAQINPKELAKEIREAAKADAIAAIRAEDHDAACTAAVDAAIVGGRVKKAERAQALKLAKADLEAFKTMTASMKLVAPVKPLYVPGEAPGTEGERTQAATLPRHRFDVYGPAMAKSEDPAMVEYATQIRWIAAYEAVPGNPKFKNPSEALKAYHAAHFNQEQTA